MEHQQSSEIGDTSDSTTPTDLQYRSVIIPSNIIEDILKRLLTRNITKEACHILTAHCNLKLAEIIKAATFHMAGCGRVKFKIEDFKQGLACCSKDTINDILPTPSKKRRMKTKENKCQKVDFKDLWLNDISLFSASIKDLSGEVQNYLNVLKEVIFLNDEKTSIILKDILTNKNIFQLVPYLVNFFCDTINKFECDFLKVSIIFRFLNSLLRNQYFAFAQYTSANYLYSLSCALVKFLAADLPDSNQGKDCWLLKDNAANILALILKRLKDQHLFFEVIHFMESVLSFKNPFNSHYGALAALNSIGVVAIVLLLPSYYCGFQEHIKRTGYSTCEKEIAFHMVKGQVIRSYYLLVDYFLKNEFKKPILISKPHFMSVDFLKDVKVFPILSKLSVSDFFGETLLPSFPLLNLTSYALL